MGKRLLAATALISLLVTMAACSKQACYPDGKRNSKPPIPFALITRAAPPLGIIAQVY